jgi:hypothetical protein
MPRKTRRVTKRYAASKPDPLDVLAMKLRDGGKDLTVNEMFTTLYITSLVLRVL